MDFSELVMKRKSVRRYDGRPVPEQALSRCLEAARWAPSACNSQPWHFYVVTDAEKKKRLAGRAFSGIYKMNRFAAAAPVLIAVTRKRPRIPAFLGGIYRGVDFPRMDLAIACEHLVLQAAELGLGTCWLGWFNERTVRKELAVPRSDRVEILISLGYPAPAQPPSAGRKAMDEIITRVD
jgi:nitroreductase